MPRYRNPDDAETLPPLMQPPKSPRKKLEESYDFQPLDMYGSSFEMTYKAFHVKISRYILKGKHRIILEIRARPHLSPLMAIDMNIVEGRKIYRIIKHLSRKRQYRRNDAKRKNS